MRFSLQYPTATPGYNQVLLEPEVMTRVAQAVESAGFNALAFSEHPAPTRAWMDAGGHDSLDLTTALAFCAAGTTHLRLMTYLLVVPYHSPFVAAKALATLDLLSAGRLVVVAGAGYLKAEFKALGVDMALRNELFDESIAVMKGLWTTSPFNHRGTHFEAREVVSSPAPRTPGGPPIWVGGNGRLARSRAARLDGWSPMMVSEAVAAMSRTPMISDPTALGRHVRSLRDQAAIERGADASTDVQVQTPHSSFLLAPGSLEEHRQHIGELVEAGVDQFMLDLPGDSEQRVHESIAWYASEVIPEFTDARRTASA
jgi:probable F420-dependent oxidoreductase